MNDLTALAWCRDNLALICFQEDGTVLVQWAGGATVGVSLLVAVRDLQQKDLDDAD